MINSVQLASIQIFIVHLQKDHASLHLKTFHLLRLASLSIPGESVQDEKSCSNDMLPWSVLQGGSSKSSWWGCCRNHQLFPWVLQNIWILSWLLKAVTWMCLSHLSICLASKSRENRVCFCQSCFQGELDFYEVLEQVITLGVVLAGAFFTSKAHD